MAWLIFLLGAALAIAGGASLASGLSYMPIEWGWTEIMAGTTALSAGIVTIALGAVLSGLSSLRRSLEARLSASPDTGLDATVPMGTQAGRIPPLSPVEAPGSSGSEGYDAPGLPMPEDISAAASPATDSTVPDGDRSDQTETAATPASRAPRHQPLLARLKGRWSGHDEPSAEMAATAAEPKLEAIDVSTAPPEMETPVEHSGFSPKSPETQSQGNIEPHMAPAAHDRPADAQSERDAIEADRGRRNGAATPMAPAAKPAAGAGLAAPFHRVGIEDLPPAPTEVGRYEAGGASYALFSDGTIEVETETGLHRFGSMEELKAFIEHQEQARSTTDR